MKIIPNRDQRILDAALELAEENGYQWITRAEVARVAEVSPATINNVYSTMVDLKRAVLAEAVVRENLAIVAQGLADRHEIVMAAPETLRKAAAAAMLEA